MPNSTEKKNFGGMSIEKFLSIVANIFFLVVGIVILALGSYGLAEINDLQENASLLSSLPLSGIAIAIICFGVVLFVISIVGVVGVVYENKVLLAYYLPIMFFLVMIQFSFTVVVLIFNSKIEDSIDSAILDEWNNPSNEDKVMELQNYFDCCGYDTTTDGVVGDCPYTRPCKDVIIDRINEFWVPITISILVIVILEIVALVSTCIAKARFETSEFEDKFYH